MGNDGGSIARRDDLVRTKASVETADKDEVRHALWTQCRLSKARLAKPVMVDRLGQLYNKDGVIEYLLRRGQGEASASENRDLREATLTPAPTSHDRHATDTYPFVCPLTQRALNGKFRVVCLWPCGCVLSESGVRETTGVSKSSAESTSPCPVCNVPFAHAALVEAHAPAVYSDVVWVNPPAEEQAAMREQLAAQKKTKRKKTDTAGGGDKRTRVQAPTLNDAAPGAYAANQVRRAQENAARNAPPTRDSEAVASLYRKTPSKRDVWLGKQAS
ncbi:hypothetical protein CBS9595_000083 [Malassezia furfur]|nr:hypothetical protein CBS9595_000083 [Malassezia furfur]